MTSSRFFTDEDVYGAIAVQLRAAVFDAVSTPEVDRLGELDASQLEWAAQEERVFVTFNVAHFAQLHYQWMAISRQHAGVIVSHQRPIGDVMRRLLHLARILDADGMQDRLELWSAKIMAMISLWSTTMRCQSAVTLRLSFREYLQVDILCSVRRC